MELRKIVQSDLFTAEEMSYTSMVVRLYKLTVQVYVSSGTEWVTPAVIHGTVLNMLGETTAHFDVAMCCRFLTIMSYNQNLAINPLSVLSDEKTKQLFMLIAMAG